MLFLYVVGKIQQAIDAVEDLMTEMRIDEENDDYRSDRYTTYIHELDTILDILKMEEST